MNYDRKYCFLPALLVLKPGNSPNSQVRNLYPPSSLPPHKPNKAGSEIERNQFDPSRVFWQQKKTRPSLWWPAFSQVSREVEQLLSIRNTRWHLSTAQSIFHPVQSFSSSNCASLLYLTGTYPHPWRKNPGPRWVGPTLAASPGLHWAGGSLGFTFFMEC